MICPGHESTDGPIGNVTYCDGTCQPEHTAENKRRADWGRKGVESGQPDNSATADPQTALTDAFANMMHFADQWGASYPEAYLSAQYHFNAEKNGDD